MPICRYCNQYYPPNTGGCTCQPTLEEARRWLKAHRDKGVHCPCCDQFAKVYTRKLNKAMARDLSWLVKRFFVLGREWVELSTAPKHLHVSRELAKLVHWDLIEMLEVPSEKGARTSGIWRPTELGIRFVRGEVTVFSHVRLYDGKFLEFAGEKMSIKEALPFDYNELVEA